MRRAAKQKWPVLLLACLLVAASAARILWLNAQWPQAQVVTIPFGEVWSHDDIQVEILDSVLGSAKETLEYYGFPSDGVREEDVILGLDQGWRGYVLAVKVRVTNMTAEEAAWAQCSGLGFYAESGPWYNGQNMLSLPLYGVEGPVSIPSGEARECVFPYVVYREHFRAGAWSRLPETEFYLVSSSIYPVKTEMLCTPALLPSAQRELL